VSSDQKTQPENTTKKDQRFQSPAFRAAVRTVLTHLGYKPTYSNFQKHDKKHGSKFPLAWYDFARNIKNIANSSSTRMDPEPTAGIYFETSVGKLIEVGKCLESIEALKEYNGRLSNG
jgi:hypothetical protein